MPHMGGEWIPGGLKTHAAGSILGFAWFSELVGLFIYMLILEEFTAAGIRGFGFADRGKFSRH